ncbi:MAG: hypothetical protein UT24_C0019G0035 [Candidatus Woesebacteria bacterium GW2011_GWB1_39_12]|uniref:Uncharacterized protein n=1 Tax=Candidatus Woesebacteria bacterium GW2011_GWB1_39_12 TaxID=1618574 RepID=A0A0G0MHY7_9BACT|nr:MAG: hypothetical protein UT24_C0019G0035 [Candidatus Woesebacteria bacterium GW2011_GWB1_39_12]
MTKEEKLIDAARNGHLSVVGVPQTRSQDSRIDGEAAENSRAGGGDGG